VGQEGSPGVMPHALGSARKCEGIDPHTPKGTPLWELESQWTLKCSKSDCKGQKLNGLKSYLYHWKAIET